MQNNTNNNQPVQNDNQEKAASPQNDKGLNRVRLEVKPAKEPVGQVALQQLLSEDWVELKPRTLLFCLVTLFCDG